MAVKLEFAQRSKFVQAFADSCIMIRRSSRHIIRNSDQLFGTFVMPIMFMVLFASVFGGAISQTLPEGISYLNFLMAGIIIQTVAFGSTTTAIGVTNDLQKGIIDRFRSLPMSNLAVLNGHVFSDLLRNGLSTIVMLIVGFIMGFRPEAGPVDWLLIVGILFLFTLAFSWLSAIAGLVAKSIEGVQLITFIIVFPLTFASGAFVPTADMTPILRAFAENQPITQVVEAIRALMLGTPIENHGWLSLAWGIGILVVSVPVAAWLFRRKTAQ